MKNPLVNTGTRTTAQNRPIPGSKQVANNAGGYAYKISNWSQLERFLVLGTWGGTYYVGPRDLTNENMDVALACLNEDPKRYVDTVTAMSVSGRAPKASPAIFALALAAGAADPQARKMALDALPAVCRTASHLFEFASYVQNMRGWGRSLRRGVANWYTREDLNLGLQVVKYRNRNGFSHRDLLRLAHVKTDNADLNAIFEWVCRQTEDERLPKIMQGYIACQKATSTSEVVKLIHEYKLTWEMVSSEHLAEKAVWEALLAYMPLGATVRNLGRLSSLGVLTEGSSACDMVRTRLTNEEALLRSRMHPISLLAAMNTYQKGHGVRGKLTWNAASSVIDSLDEAFYMSFDNVEPSGKKIMLGIDVSGSMGWPEIAGIAGLTPRTGSMAMAMATARVESNPLVMAFSHKLVPITISPRQRLDDIIRATDRIPFGGTDCSLPMAHALKENLMVDTFVIYTDSETWAGRIHPSQALREYREQMNPKARLIVCGMTSTGFSIADPDDQGMLDIVGFDSSAPEIIRGFSANDF